MSRYSELKNGSPDPIEELWDKIAELESKGSVDSKAVEKISCLRMLLEAQNSKPMLGTTDVKYVAVLTLSEAHRVKKKLFQLIEKL